MPHGNEETHIPHCNTVPAFKTYVVTSNKTLKDGSVVNVDEANAEYARNFVNMNKK